MRWHEAEPSEFDRPKRAGDESISGEVFWTTAGRGNHIIAFLSDDDGMALTLTSTAPGDERAVHYPKNFHIGFAQSGADAVNALHQRLKADGYNVPEPSRQHGSWTFYFEAPGGFTIEVLS